MTEDLSALPTLVRFLPGFIKRRIANRPNLVKILDNIGWLFFDKILRMGVGLIVGVWLARYLGPEQFGMFNFATAFVGMFGAVAGLGLKGMVVQHLVYEPSCDGKILGSAAILQIISGVIAYFLVVLVVICVRPEDKIMHSLVAIIGSMLLFKAGEVVQYWFEAKVLSRYIVLVQNVVFLIFFTAKICLLIANASVIAFAWAALFEVVAVALALMLVSNSVGKPFMSWEFCWLRAKRLLQESWPLMISGFAVVVYMRMDQVMLGQMLGDEAVGIYSAAVRVAESVYFAPMLIVSSIFPSLLEIKTNNEGLFVCRLQKLFDLLALMAFVFVLFFFFLSEHIIYFMYKSEYLGSSVVLSIYIWGAVFVYLDVAASRWYMSENLQIFVLLKSILGVTVNVALNFSLIPLFGVAGAAFASVVAQLSSSLFFDLFFFKTRKVFYMKIRSIFLINLIRSGKHKCV